MSTIQVMVLPKFQINQTFPFGCNIVGNKSIFPTESRRIDVHIFIIENTRYFYEGAEFFSYTIV